MQPYQTLSVLLTLAVGVSAGCYSGGNQGEGGGDGKYGIGLKEVIMDNTAHLLNGWYLAGEERWHCAQDRVTKNKWKFYLKNTAKKGKWAETDAVKKWFEAEAYGCQFGGENHKEGFNIVVDPNPGVCISTAIGRRGAEDGTAIPDDEVHIHDVNAKDHGDDEYTAAQPVKVPVEFEA